MILNIHAVNAFAIQIINAKAYTIIFNGGGMCLDLTDKSYDNTQDIWRYLLSFTEMVINLNMSSKIRCRVDMKNAGVLANHFNFINFAKTNNQSKSTKKFQCYTKGGIFDLRWS